MNDLTTPSALDRVRSELAGEPGTVLEAVAARHGVSLQAAVECLPPAMWTRIDGEHFVAVMQDLAEWGDVTVIVHTKDVILEFDGPVPAGSLGHGFYNLKGKGGLHGHLRAENCRAILFLRRPFMGSDTASVQFFNADGEAMFKVFVGRDAERRLKKDQLDRLALLEERFRVSAGGCGCAAAGA